MYIRYKDMVDGILKQYSDKTAITYMRNDGGNTRVSFKEVKNFLLSIERTAREIGLKKGDRVSIISQHSPWAVFTGIALTYAGMTIVLIDASLPHEEIKKLLDFSDVKAIFTTELMRGKLKEGIKSEMPCFNLDKGFDIELFDTNNVDSFVFGHTVDSDSDVIAILYSSGTTGEMKGIMVTYESVLKAREVFVRLSGLKDYMTYMLVLPFNHIAGFTGAMTFFLTGCEIGFIEDVNASKLQKGLLEFQPHYFAMVPKVYEVMEEKIRTAIHEKGKTAEIFINAMFKVSKFFRKYLGVNIGKKLFKNITKQVFGEKIFGIGTGAVPCKAETTEFFLNLGLEWANLYATTETSVPIVATGILDKYPVDTVGNVNHHSEISVKIRNADANGIGEIMVKSELMMKGYFRRPDLTEEVFDNGFFKTGDYGFIDKKGYLHITGRIKESIVLENGKKVSPSDVDDYYLERVSGDYDIASRGISNERGNFEEIHMFITNREYSNDEQKAIRDLFEEISRKAPSMYKLSEIHFVTSIPRTSIGKVKRFCLEKKDDMLDEKIKKKDVINTSKLIEIFSRHCNALDITFESKIIEDLGLDSLTIFTIVCEIEKEYQIDISAKMERVVTVKDIYDLVNKGEIDTKKDYPKQKSKKMINSLKRWINLSELLYEINATGEENIPTYDDYIICANHESYFDPLWILAAMKDKVDLSKVCCMAAKHTMEGKVSHNLFQALGGISVDREGNTIPAMHSAKKCLENGHTMIIFPEGARSRDGSLLPFKSGAAKLAIDTNKKIIPVRIDGSFEIFSRWIKRPRLFDWKHFRKYKLRIKFGTVIDPEGMTVDELTTKLKQEIVEMKCKRKDE